MAKHIFHCFDAGIVRGNLEGIETDPRGIRTETGMLTEVGKGKVGESLSEAGITVETGITGAVEMASAGIIELTGQSYAHINSSHNFIIQSRPYHWKGDTSADIPMKNALLVAFLWLCNLVSGRSICNRTQ